MRRILFNSKAVMSDGEEMLLDACSKEDVTELAERLRQHDSIDYCESIDSTGSLWFAVTFKAHTYDTPYKTDDEVRQAYLDTDEADDCYLIDGFATAVVGVSQDGRLVYDHDAIMSHLTDAQNMPHDEASEYYCYNIVRAFPYHQPSPIILMQLDE